MPKIKSEPEPKNKEAFTSIARVLGRKYEGISEEERQKVFKHIEETFEDQGKLKKNLLRDFGSVENIPPAVRTIFFERSKTPEELEIIDIINKRTNRLRRRFGLLDLNVPPENVYLVKDTDWPEELDSDCYYNPAGQFIVVREPKITELRDSKITFAKNLIHEMLHFKHLNSLKKLENSDSFSVYGFGLKNYTRQDDLEPYFGNLNEAIVEELTIRVLQELRDNSLFKKEFEQTEEIIKLLSNETDTDGRPLLNGNEFYIASDQENNLYSADFRRTRERVALGKLIEKIYQKNKNNNRFKNKEEIFDIFVKSIMTGKIINLGHLVDQTFGKETFKKIAEADNNLDKLEKLIEGL